MGAANIVQTREGAVGNTGWLTPADVFERIADEFGPFDLDPAGDPSSPATQGCLAYRTAEGSYNWTPDGPQRVADHDGLSYLWRGHVFVNPPYRRVEAWVRMGYESALAGATVVMLLIPSTDARWFHRYVWDARLHRPRGNVEVRFLEGRIRFVHPDPEKRETDFKGFRPISGNMLVIFHPAEAAP